MPCTLVQILILFLVSVFTVRINEVFKKVVFIDDLHEGADLALKRVEDATERRHLTVAFLAYPVINLEVRALVLNIVMPSKSRL